MRVQENIGRALNTMKFFPLHKWTFDSKNIKNLTQTLSGTDTETFNFDLSTIDWKNYTENACMGLKKYFFKDDPNTLAAAKLRSKRLLTVFINKMMFKYSQFIYRPIYFFFSLLLLFKGKEKIFY